MRDSIILAALLIAAVFALPASAETVTTSDERHGEHTVTVHDATEDRYEEFDWGYYGQAIVYETPNTEWGFLGTYLNDSDETRVMAGGKIYLNRMTYQKQK